MTYLLQDRVLKLTNKLMHLIHLLYLGYAAFFNDFYNKIIVRISQTDSTYDIIKILQTFSEISDHYKDLYTKIETIILSRYELLEPNEASCIACAFSISGYGSQQLFHLIEKLLMSKFNFIDDTGFREAVRGIFYFHIISLCCIEYR